MELEKALGLITEVPDFPQPGVLFRDFAPLFASADGFAAVTAALGEVLGTPGAEIELLAAVEARGFMLAAALGQALGLGVVMVRKPGKLPRVAGRADYELEYGRASLELPQGVVLPGQRVAVIDDVLATGGTVAAACRLLEEAGAVVATVAVVLELGGLGGRAHLPGQDVRSLLVA